MSTVRSTSLSKRVFLGVGANVIGKVWVLALQLLTVPVLVGKWSPDGYGVWLMLSAVPTYAALSDFGFGAAARVDMTKCSANNDKDGALGALQSVWVLISAVSLALIASVLLAGVIFRPSIAHMAANEYEILVAGILLFLYSLIVVQMSLVNVAYQSTGRYAQGTFYYDLLSPVEGGLLIIIALVGGHYVAGALEMLLIRAIGFALYYTALRRSEPWIHLGWSHATILEVKKLTRPALAALGLPLSTAVNIQGVVFVIGLALSPATAAMFGTVRTISRVPLQLVGILSRATLPEITVAHTNKNHTAMNKLVIANLLAVALITVPAALALVMAGPWILRILSRGLMTATPILFVIMAAIMVFQTTWNTFGTFLFSLNLQEHFSPLYAGLSVLSVAIAYFTVGSLGVNFVGLLMLLVDIIMVIVVARVWSTITYERGGNYRHWTQDLRSMTVQLGRKIMRQD